MELTVVERRDDAVSVLALSGDVDVASAPALRELLDQEVARQDWIVIDLDGVAFMDSTAIGVLVGRMRRARHKGGSLSLVCSVPRLLRIFEITGLGSVFAVYEDLDSAIAAIGRHHSRNVQGA